MNAPRLFLGMCISPAVHDFSYELIHIICDLLSPDDRKFSKCMFHFLLIFRKSILKSF